MIKKELLSVVEVLRKFCTILYMHGTDLTIHTDHKNLTYYTNLNTKRVLQWRLHVGYMAPNSNTSREKQ